MKRFLSLIFCVMISVNAFGQAKEITEKEYREIIDSANKKLSSTSYRAESKLTVFDDGEIYLTIEWQRAYLMPDKKFYKNTRTVRGETEKIEQIQIGKLTFCRKNDGKWEKSKSSCETGMVSTASNIETSKFSSEDVKIKDENFRVFENYYTYSSFSNTAKKFFNKRKSWISRDGFLIKEEIENGSVGEEMPNKEIISYEYNPKNLKIEAPIK